MCVLCVSRLPRPVSFDIYIRSAFACNDRKGHACDAQFAWGRCLIWGVASVEGVEGTGKVSQVSQEVTGFFRSSACVRATVDNSDNAGPLRCAGRWRALQLHVPAALTRAARARHADADLVNLSLRPTYDQPPVAPAARALLTPLHFANAGAMQVTTPSWRIVTRAAPLLTDLGNLSTPHLRPAPCTCRAFLTLLRLPRQVPSCKSLHQAVDA